MNRRGIVGLSVAALVTVGLAAGLAWGLLRQDKAQGHGPLVLPRPGALWARVPIPINAPVSNGLLSVVNRSDKTLTLQRASLVNPGHGLELVGAYVLPIPNSRQIGLVRGYQVRPQGQVLQGLRLAPHARVQIVLGMRVIEPGRFGFKAVRLDYSGDGASFRDSYPLSGRLCSPVSAYGNGCSGLRMQ